MALKGTLKDFGIADILQLIGQQAKTGVLYIKSKSEEVEVSFLEGNVVRALSKTRRSRELLGSLLVGTGLVTETELDEALEIQKRTLKRLGDILVAEGKVTSDQLREMTQLQTTETLYKLFAWKNGTYEFVQQDVEHDPAQGGPIRPESVLMEGFRRIDEWPMVKRRITSMLLTFERRKHLAPPPLKANAGGDEVDAALDAALDAGKAAGEAVPRSIGRNERTTYRLADPGLSAQRLSELTRLGEFETCKALFNLIEAGYLAAVAPKKGAETPVEKRRPFLGPETGQALRRGVVQMAIGLLLVVLFAIAARGLGQRPATSTSVMPADTGAARRALADTQLTRIASALELYRLGHDHYPESLDKVVAGQLLDSAELLYPYETTYHYRRAGDVYVLLPPLR